MNIWHAIEKHLDTPIMQHLRPFLTDLYSSLQNFESHVINLYHEQETRLNQIIQTLTSAVADLTVKVTDHDTAVQAAVAKINTALDAGDLAAIKAAVDSVSSASSKIAGETQAINDSVQVAASQPAPDPAPAAATDTSDPAATTTTGQ